MRKITTILFFYLILNTPNIYAQEVDRIIAIVNNQPITKSEYDSLYRQRQIQTNQPVTRTRQSIDPNILEALINQRIQTQYAQQLGLVVSDKDIEETIEQVAHRQNSTVSQLFSFLSKNGISRDDFVSEIKSQILIQILLQRQVHSRIRISDEEIEYHIQSNSNRYRIDQSYEIAHLPILTTDLNSDQKAAKLEKALVAQQALENGADFRETFTNYSEGGDASTYGYMGWLQYASLPSLFSNELQNLSIGEVSEVLESDNGYHIIQLLDKRGETNIVTQNLIRRIIILPQRRNLSQRQALTLAQSIIDEIKESGNFEDAAKRHSDDELSATNGGSLGWINPGEINPEVEQAVASLTIDQISEPIITPFSIDIVQVTDRREKDITLELARKNARDAVFQSKVETSYRNLFSDLRREAYVEIINQN